MADVTETVHMEKEGVLVLESEKTFQTTDKSHKETKKTDKANKAGVVFYELYINVGQNNKESQEVRIL